MNVNEKRWKAQKGFSLVELMIVVAIIGILSAIAVPNFRNFQAKSRQSEAKSVLSALYVANKAFYNEWQGYHGDFGRLGYKPEGIFRYEHGFGGVGPVPVNYQGPPARAVSTVLDCAADVIGGLSTSCGVIRGGTIAPGAISTAAPTGVLFTAEARGDLNNVAGVDTWTIDQNKLIVNQNSDLD